MKAIGMLGELVIDVSENEHWHIFVHQTEPDCPARAQVMTCHQAQEALFGSGAPEDLPGDLAIWSPALGQWTMNGAYVGDGLNGPITEHAKNLGVDLR